MKPEFIYFGILSLLGYFACKDFFHRRVVNRWLILGVTVSLLLLHWNLEPFAASLADWFLASLCMFLFALLFYYFGFFAAGDVKFAFLIGGFFGINGELFFILFLSNFFIVFHALARFFYKKCTDEQQVRQGNFFIPYAGYMAFSSMIVISYYLL